MSTPSQFSITSTTNPDHRLSGKVAIVTGASRGLGESTARELGRLGASVVLAARDEKRLNHVAKGIEDTGGTAYPVVVDITQADDIRRMVDLAVERYGRLDFAVNNAGITSRKPFLEAQLEEFEKVMSTNVRSVFLCMQSEIAAMLTSGSGSIVNVSSVGGLLGVPNLSMYTMSKAAVIGLSKSVALEYATKGIRINVIAPGGMETAMLAGQSKEQREMLTSVIPMKRISDPLEVARGIIYLLVDATYSTGITLSADGGQSVP